MACEGDRLVATGADEPSGPGRAGRVEAAGDDASCSRAVEDRQADACRAERGHGFGGPAQEAPGSISLGAGLAGGLAEHDEHLSALQRAAGSEIGQERGVVAGCPLQCDVGEARCGVQERVDGGADVESLGPHEYLDRFGE